MVRLFDDLFTAQQVAHHQAHLAAAVDDRQLAQFEVAGRHLALQAAAVVDVEVDRRRQRGLALQHGQRVGHEAGLQLEIRAPLQAGVAQRQAPAATVSDGVAQSQAGQMLRQVAVPGRVQPRQAARAAAVAAVGAADAADAQVAATSAKNAGLQPGQQAAAAAVLAGLQLVVQQRAQARRRHRCRQGSAQRALVRAEGSDRGVDLERLRRAINAGAQPGVGQAVVFAAAMRHRHGGRQGQCSPVGTGQGQAAVVGLQHLGHPFVVQAIQAQAPAASSRRPWPARGQPVRPGCTGQRPRAQRPGAETATWCTPWSPRTSRVSAPPGGGACRRKR